MKTLFLVFSLTVLFTGCTEVMNENAFNRCMEEVNRKPVQDVQASDIRNCKAISVTIKLGF